MQKLGNTDSAEVLHKLSIYNNYLTRHFHNLLYYSIEITQPSYCLYISIDTSYLSVKIYSVKSENLLLLLPF